MWGVRGEEAAPRRARRAVLCAGAVSFCGLAVCSGGSSGSSGVIEADLVPALGGETFTRAVKLVQHPADADRWYVVEQGGVVWTLLASDPAGSRSMALVLSPPAFDLGSGNEQGLLGLAFDPAFGVSSDDLYLTYTDDDAGESVLARYESTDGGLTFDEVDPMLLRIDHPNDIHNAGDIHFGPDGFLYYSMGDGGGVANRANGQDTTTLLGSVMRIDVRSAPPMGLRYAIPSGNPFEANPHCTGGSGAMPCPEIWASGFRNPWRMGFDPDTGDLWLGDVGEATLEEIDLIVREGNYGWQCFEGDVPFNDVPPCAPPFEPPEAVHGRDAARAISGGVVYRGDDIPELQGFYVYGDFITGNYWALDTGSMAPPVPLQVPSLGVSAFGQDREGEVYVVSFGSPSIYRLAPAP